LILNEFLDLRSCAYDLLKLEATEGKKISDVVLDYLCIVCNDLVTGSGELSGESLDKTACGNDQKIASFDAFFSVLESLFGVENCKAESFNEIISSVISGVELTNIFKIWPCVDDLLFSFSVLLPVAGFKVC